MDSRPDLIVGIDFGMTCTGVAYANLSIGSDSVRWIQKWPGRSQANENKVPTVVVYPKNQPIPCSWGFLSETVSEQKSAEKEYKSWFKTYLDPLRLTQAQYEDSAGTPKSTAEVEKYYEDYLRLLYRHIEFKLGSEIQGSTWQTAQIEFVLGVPTTWKPPVVEKFRTMIGRAGFGSWPGHTVSIGLTEAEAAAVHTSIEASGIFRENDVLLVCDAGGGTTDLSVLRVTDTKSHALSLQQLDVVFGATIGSASIDRDFQRFVTRLLEGLRGKTELTASIDAIAWEMMKSQDFQNTKCEHGGLDDTPIFSIPLPKVDHAYVDETVGISNGEMRFTREDLQTLFDRQVQKLIKLIDYQLQNLHQKFPGQPVAHLVLSGGLGHSPYVQQRLRSQYTTGQGYPNARNLQVRIAPDPQLAVCKGIVADRVRKLRAGKSVLSYRCCRASYGTICRELYNKTNPQHSGRETFLDPMNGKLYVTQSIAWFVIKGEPASADKPIVHDFMRKVQPGDPRRAFPTSIVVSHVDKEYLPHHMGSAAQVLCEIHADLSTADERQFKRKNRHFWNAGKAFFKVDYQVKVLIGPADIRFELWFNGQKLNKDQPIKVEWTEGTAVAPEPEPEPPLLNEEPIWKLGSPKSSMPLRGSLSGMVQRSSAKSPISPYELGHQGPLSTVGSYSSGVGKDTSPSTTTSHPIEIGDNSPVEDPRAQIFRPRELP